MKDLTDFHFHPIKKYPPSLNFNTDGGQTVGRLYWNDGKLNFEGDMEESGKIFIEYLNKLFTEQIKG